MEEKKYNFVYLTTNIVNGKQYIGDHSTNIDPNKDTYLGSGRPYFQNALNEYGKQNFKREILEFFSTKQEAFNAQEKYIIKYNTLIPSGYNMSPKGGNMYKGSVSENSKELIRQSKLGQKNPMFGKSPNNKGKKMTEEQIKKMKDHKFSKEHRRKLSESHKDQIPWNKGTSKKLQLQIII
jgi:group I intron endonuclease